MKKKVVLGTLLCSIALVTTLSHSDPMDQFAAALASLGEAGGKSSSLHHRFLSPIERKQRTEALRKKVQDNIVMTPQEARDTMVQYLLDRFVDLFQGLADILGDAVKKVNSPSSAAAGEAVKRLPGTFAAGFFLTYNLMREIATPVYVAHLKSLRKALNCLLYKNERAGTQCAEYTTVKDALSGVFDHMKPFLLPFAKALFLGVEMKDADGSTSRINGWIPLGIGVVAPGSSAEKDLGVIIELVNIVLNFGDQYKEFAQEAPATHKRKAASDESYKASVSHEFELL